MLLAAARWTALFLWDWTSSAKRDRFLQLHSRTLMNDYMTLLPKERVVAGDSGDHHSGSGSDGGMHPAQDGRVSSGSRRFSRRRSASGPRPAGRYVEGLTGWRRPRNSAVIARGIYSPRFVFLAEKIETPEDLKVAMELGFHYFQGYFFQKPVILHTGEISPMQIHALSLLREVRGLW